MSVIISTRFYEASTPAWHNLAKIVFTSPNMDSPITAGSRSDILFGRADVGTWYEDSSNMYRIAEGQQQDSIVYYTTDSNGKYVIYQDYNLSNPGQFSYLGDNYLLVSGTVDNFYSYLKTLYGNSLSYSEVTASGYCNITVSGSTIGNLNSLFNTGYSYLNTASQTTITGSEILNVDYLAEMCENRFNTFDHKLSFYMSPEFYYSRTTLNSDTLYKGWVGKKITTISGIQECWLDFVFDSPTRITKISFDGVTCSGVTVVQYDYNSYNTTWSGTNYSYNDDTLTADFTFSDQWLLTSGTGTYLDDKWFCSIDSITTNSGCAYNSYNYGFDRYKTYNFYYNKTYEINSIQIKAKKTELSDWFVLYNGTFNGEVSFGNDCYYKYYRIYLVDTTTSACPEGMDPYVYEPLSIMGNCAITTSGITSHSYTEMFTNKDYIINDELVSSLNTLNSGTSTLQFVNRDSACFSLAGWHYEDEYALLADFYYRKDSDNYETKESGWIGLSTISGSYIQFGFSLPVKITKLSFDDITYSNRQYNYIDYYGYDTTWSGSRNHTESGITLNTTFSGGIGYDEGYWTTSVEDSTLTGCSYTSALSHTSTTIKRIVSKEYADTETYRITNILFQGYNTVSGSIPINPITLYNGSFNGSVTFNNENDFFYYRIVPIETYNSTLSDTTLKEVPVFCKTNITASGITNFIDSKLFTTENLLSNTTIATGSSNNNPGARSISSRLKIAGSGGCEYYFIDGEVISCLYDRDMYKTESFEDGLLSEDSGEAYIDFEFADPNRIVGFYWEDVDRTVAEYTIDTYHTLTTKTSIANKNATGCGGSVSYKLTYDDFYSEDGKWKALSYSLQDVTEAPGLTLTIDTGNYYNTNVVDTFVDNTSYTYGVSTVKIQAKFNYDSEWIDLYTGEFNSSTINIITNNNSYRFYRINLLSSKDYYFAIRNLKLYTYYEEIRKDYYGIRNLKLYKYQCDYTNGIDDFTKEDDYYGISNLKFYDYSFDDTSGVYPSIYFCLSSNSMARFDTDNITSTPHNVGIDKVYSMRLNDNVWDTSNGIISAGTSGRIYTSNTDITALNSVIFTTTLGKAYDCRVTAWDDASHSTTNKDVLNNGLFVVSIAFFYLVGVSSESVLFGTIDEDKMVHLLCPSVNTVLKGDFSYYGTVDMRYRYQTDYYGDYLFCKPNVYGIDSSITPGVNQDFLMVLHYSYT